MAPLQATDDQTIFCRISNAKMSLIMLVCIFATTLAQGPQGPHVQGGYRSPYDSTPAIPIATSGTSSHNMQTTHQRTSDANFDPDNPNNNNDICIGGEAWCSLPEGNERLALEAIRTLHRQLDDDKNGNIDLDESDEFLREELKYERDYEKRQKAFHQNDDNQVSVKELWETWVKSEVHNWTAEQTSEWLSLFVGLPQYKEKFLLLHINGTYLPRLAVNHQNLLSTTIGIKDLINKQRIALKAQDVVLFGPPKDLSNSTKDAILISLLCVALAVCYLVYNRYKISQRDLTRMMKDMAELSNAEQALLDLQKEWKMEKEKTDQEMREREAVIRESIDDENSTDELARLREELMVLRNELQRAEVELQDKCWLPPPALQHWLQLTYELELKSYNKKKGCAEKQLKQAKEACDKLKKKRSSLMGAFVSTHGKSIDDVDKAILEARTALTEITNELQERMNRWKQIEKLANCSIMNNPGLSFLENHLRGIGKPPSYVGPGSVISNSQDDIDDDGASSIYCPSAVSAPASNLHLPIMRSKSVSSMLSLKERGASRESSKESSTGEDDVTLDSSEMTSARDRRVTFGVRTDHRNGHLMRSLYYNSHGVPSGQEFDSKESEESRKVNQKMPPSANSVDNAKSEESKRQRVSKEEPDLIKVQKANGNCESVHDEDLSVVNVKSVESVRLNSRRSSTVAVEKIGFWKAISKFVRKNDGLKTTKGKNRQTEDVAGAQSDSPSNENNIPQKKKSKTSRKMSNLFTSLRRSNSTRSSSKSAKTNSSTNSKPA